MRSGGVIYRSTNLAGKARRAQEEPFLFKVHMAKEHVIPFPFHEECMGDRCSWIPGCRREESEEYAGHVFGEETWRKTYSHIADEMGAMLITEQGRVKIEGFRERVAFTRQWRDPYGKVFGKRDLRFLSAASFTKMVNGYRYSYFLDGDEVLP